MDDEKFSASVRKFLRIESENVLRALDQIEKEHRDAAEEQHRGAVLGPVHFAVFVDAAEFVEEAFDWAEGEVEERFFAIEDARHERAERFCDRENDGEEKEDLKPTVGRHG